MKKDKKLVTEIFNNIAPKYDLLNRLLSLGIDKSWRRKLLKTLKKINIHQNSIILDAATGTADMAIELIKLEPKKIFGIDIAKNMLNIAEKKIKVKKLDKLIELRQCDSEQTNFQENTFDLITCVFGLRNLENPIKGLKEFNRILKPNGYLAILEFSNKRNSIFDVFFKIYFEKILPIIGKKISHDPIAYYYLPKSVKEFPSGKDFCKILEKQKFTCIFSRKMNFGVVYMYIAKKIQ